MRNDSLSRLRKLAVFTSKVASSALRRLRESRRVRILLWDAVAALTLGDNLIWGYAFVDVDLSVVLGQNVG